LLRQHACGARAPTPGAAWPPPPAVFFDPGMLTPTHHAVTRMTAPWRPAAAPRTTCRPGWRSRSAGGAGWHRDEVARPPGFEEHPRTRPRSAGWRSRARSGRRTGRRWWFS